MELEILTAEEVAKILRVTPHRVYQLTRMKGGLPAVRLGRTVRIARADLEAFIARHGTTRGDDGA